MKSVFIRVPNRVTFAVLPLVLSPPDFRTWRVSKSLRRAWRFLDITSSLTRARVFYRDLYIDITILEARIRIVKERVQPTDDA